MEIDMTGFDVRFEYETSFDIDGFLNVFNGTVFLTGYSNGSWDLDNIEGELIEDPETATDSIDLSVNENTRKAVMKYLKWTQTFHDDADERVMEEIHDQF
jgi:hypothetical protein